MKPKQARLASIVWTLLATLTWPAASLAKSTGSSNPRGAGAVGTISTVAGPGFCNGPTEVDLRAVAVSSLAVDSAGRLFFDIGYAGNGAIARVEQGHAELVPTGMHRRVRAAGRTAADGTGGAIVASANYLVDFTSAGPTLIAGQPAVPGQIDDDRPRKDRGPEVSSPLSGVRFVDIRSIASDDTGNLFVSDRIKIGHAALRIRFLNRGPRPVTFYSGTPAALTVPPDSAATIVGASIPAKTHADEARFSSISGPGALAPLGSRLYVSTADTSKSGKPRSGIKMINLGGAPITAHGVNVPAAGIQTVAGGTHPGRKGDGGRATKASISRVRGIAADARGNLYLADLGNHRIRRVDAAGVITTIAGGKKAGFNGNDRPAKTALLHSPWDVKVGPGGHDIFVSDNGNGQVRVIDANGVIHIAEGQGMFSPWTCGPFGILDAGKPALTGAPASVAVGSDRVVYIGLQGFPQVKRFDSSGQLVNAIGSVDAERICLDGPGCFEPDPDARGPSSIAAGPDRGLYLMDSEKGLIRYANFSSRTVTVHGVEVDSGGIETLAGTGTPGEADFAGPAKQGQLSGKANGPSPPMSSDGQGNLYIAEANRIKRIDAAGTMSTVIGPDDCCIKGRLAGLAADRSGVLLVSANETEDGPTGSLWAFNPSQTELVFHGKTLLPSEHLRLAGGGTGAGGDSRPGLEARFSAGPITVDQNSQVYLAEAGTAVIPGSNKIDKLDFADVLTTVAGTGDPGFNGDGRQARQSTISGPIALASNDCGDVFIADTGNDRVRRFKASSACVVTAAKQSSAIPRPSVPAVLIAVAIVAGCALIMAFRFAP